MTELDDLLELQQLDTQLDQLRHRRTTIPEHETARAAQMAVAASERRRREIDTALDELASAIRAEEATSADIDAQRAKLETQLKTIIAPREAEALMHEIAGLKAKRGELDDSELEHLERQEQLEAERSKLADEEESVRETARGADDALAAALAEIDRDIAGAEERREPSRSSIPDGLLSRYDRLRSNLGVAISRLNNRQCEGCHLQLSAVELDEIKAAPPDDPVECPQCGRMLVRR